MSKKRIWLLLYLGAIVIAGSVIIALASFGGLAFGGAVLGAFLALMKIIAAGWPLLLGVFLIVLVEYLLRQAKNVAKSGYKTLASALENGNERVSGNRSEDRRLPHLEWVLENSKYGQRLKGLLDLAKEVEVLAPDRHDQIRLQLRELDSVARDYPVLKRHLSQSRTAKEAVDTFWETTAIVEKSLENQLNEALSKHRDRQEMTQDVMRQI